MEMEQRDLLELVYSLSNRKGGDFEYIKSSLAFRLSRDELIARWERCESRDSRTVLRGAGGEIPPVYLQDDLRVRRTLQRFSQLPVANEVLERSLSPAGWTMVNSRQRLCFRFPELSILMLQVRRNPTTHKHLLTSSTSNSGEFR